MSTILSGLTEKGFGYGGLKLGGSENSKLGASLVLIEVEFGGISENSSNDLIETLVLDILRVRNCQKIRDEAKFRTPAIGFRREGVELKKVKNEEKEECGEGQRRRLWLCRW
ncbi:hypothetical protein LOK49_LG01G04187 [Camellia lanceoleosa]|uniref:Uncharacterized protein n=1 Tax=Camellia lanceoleosa TaxID=1840588 RepID=A0ACC0IZT8_9ERIC|nr:hypothetical protein LOK49_LG01G04187 [Camellia lanceoleosa]